MPSRSAAWGVERNIVADSMSFSFSFSARPRTIPGHTYGNPTVNSTGGGGRFAIFENDPPCVAGRGSRSTGCGASRPGPRARRSRASNRSIGCACPHPNARLSTNPVATLESSPACTGPGRRRTCAASERFSILRISVPSASLSPDRRAPAFASSGASGGGPGYCTVTRSRPVVACPDVASRRYARPAAIRAYQRSAPRSCTAYSGSAPGRPWRRPSSSPASRRRPEVSATPRRSARLDPSPDSTPT